MSMVMLHSPQIMYLTRDIKTSCTLLGTVAIYQRPVVAGGGFFLLLDLGPGAAACGMGIEINTGNSCYLSAARRRRGRFFSPIGSGPRGSGLWNGDRDKHWEQLLFISGPSSPGAVFFSYWIWAQGQRLVEWG